MQFALPFQEFPIDGVSSLCAAQETAPIRRKPRRASATLFDYPPDPDLINMTELLTPSPDIIGATEPVDTVDAMPATESEHTPVIHEARLWQDDGWTARVIKNEDDEGWAVEMCKDGESEPALVGPWTMGRDKKNPKPLDAAAFTTLVKTASEVLRRHEQQLHAMLHKSMTVNTRTATIHVSLDIVPDEDDPYAILTAVDADGDELAQQRVLPSFKLTMASATAWAEGGFRAVGQSGKSGY